MLEFDKLLKTEDSNIPIQKRHSLSSILFAGAAGEVTGSRHLLSLPAGKLLLDCGMFQGRREESDAKTRKFLFEASSVDAVILSHGHIDHCGALPLLVKQGFKGSIFCTAATVELAKLLLLDSARIQDQDAYFWNKRHPAQKILPMYDEKDVDATLRLLKPVAMKQAFEPLPGVTAILYEAGHILGSVQVSLEWKEGDQAKDLYFSGDLGPHGTPLLEDPYQPTKPPQVLLLESTYGDREHGQGGPALDALEKAIAPVIARGGKVVIPSFAVGRTQELIYELAELMQAKRLPTITVYVDSPLAEATTQLFRKHRELMDEGFRKTWGTLDPFDQPFVHYTNTKEQSQAINAHQGPCIILSASGMCESGRILHHLGNLAPDPKNLILFVGFQAQGTLGRRIRDGAKVARIFGEDVPVAAAVGNLEGFSAHAGRTELLQFAGGLGGKPGQIYLVHGELTASSALGSTLREQGFKVDVPALGKVCGI